MSSSGITPFTAMVAVLGMAAGVLFTRFTHHPTGEWTPCYQITQHHVDGSFDRWFAFKGSKVNDHGALVFVDTQGEPHLVTGDVSESMDVCLKGDS